MTHVRALTSSSYTSPMFCHRSTSLQMSSTGRLNERLNLTKGTSLLLLTSAFGSLTNWMSVTQTKSAAWHRNWMTGFRSATDKRHGRGPDL